MPIRSTYSLLIVSGMCLAAFGCANFRNGTYAVRKVEDPPQLSPYNRSLTQQGPVNGPYRGGSAYRGPFGGFFTPGTRTILPPQSTPQQNFRGQPNLSQSFPTRPYPTQPYPTQPYNVQRPQFEQQVPEPREPTDSFGTELGAPQDFSDSPPTLGAPSPVEDLDAPEETIRQHSTPDALASPSPNRTFPESNEPSPRTYESVGKSLELIVNTPEDVLAGETVEFQIVIRNPTSVVVDNVVIECRFDEGLTFPGLEERALRQRLGTLGAAESRTMDLGLTAESIGTLCVDFTVTADDLDTTTQKRCVVCTSQSVQIDLVGPQTRNVGGRLECVLTVSNRTGHEVSGIVAAINHDGALEPREASAGAIRLPGRLQWDLGLLRVEEQVQIQVEFGCPTATEQTCITADVSGRDVATENRELCAVITPRPTLDVAVADSRDPVPVGETTTYLITLTNRGLSALSDVRIDVDLDGGLEMIPHVNGVANVAMVSDPASAPRSATHLITGPIAPDDERTIRIDVRGATIGTGGLRVSATEIATEHRVLVEEPTVVNPALLDFPSFTDIADAQ